MKRVLTAFVALIVVLLGAAAPAQAKGHGDGLGGNTTDGGALIHDQEGQQQTEPGVYHHGQPYTPTQGPPPPVVEDYYTPSCSVNGPPGEGNGDAMCMAAASGCKFQGQDGAILMQHWTQQVSPTKGPWVFQGNECRGPDAPTVTKPKITVAMVLDQAYAAAPKPDVVVQPGTKSFVNLPNNYWADAPSKTIPVVVLGQTIPVTFTVTDVKWDFGDGASADGAGVKDAALHQPGAVEHEYASQGSYAITATSVIRVSFAIPGGGTQDLPGALEIPSGATTLPVGEIQTRVDQTS